MRDVPNQSASGVTNQAEEHQEANEYIKEQQSQVPQPPVSVTQGITLCMERIFHDEKCVTQFHHTTLRLAADAFQ